MGMGQKTEMAREQVGALVMLYVAYVVFADDTPVQLEAGAPAPAIRRSLWGTSGEARSPQSPDRRMREVLTLLQLTPLAAINKTNTTKCAIIKHAQKLGRRWTNN